MEAVGAKTARACDGCLRRRARWYCAADDAFLCQECDGAVHSANPLARRHERLRLRPAAAPLPLLPRRRNELAVPEWFTRKARTPRGNKRSVPELSDEQCKGDEEEEVPDEEQLLYRVPVFDPALAEFCSPPPPPLEEPAVKSDVAAFPTTPASQYFSADGDGLAVFGPTDAELNEFAADMEALLGHDHDDSLYMESLGLVEGDGERVKMEPSGCCAGDASLAAEMLEPAEVSDDMFDIDFDCGSPIAIEEADVDSKDDVEKTANVVGAVPPRLTLRLVDHESIIASWGSSPWTDGRRPQLMLDDRWPHDYSGMWVRSGGREELLAAARAGMDGGREARVSRYREKRRTRLFSKKIRYEVRKLNAEKRPRMKGRFVKRALP